ncbi:MAG: sialidase family protein [Verrucomicrobiales bacterium]
MKTLRIALLLALLPFSLLAEEWKQKKKPRFPGFISEGFIYEKGSFPQCHASTICETPRGLVAAWFGGTKEKHPDVGIWSSYNDGSGWSSPKEWANGIQHEDLRHPCWNPVLVQPPGDAPTMLFFKVGPTPRTWWGEVILSYDYGRSFRDRRRLPSTIDGPVRCKPLFLENGDLLCPSSTEHDHDWRFHFEILTDHSRPELGTSWKRIEPKTQPYQVIQPTLLTQSDGSLRALMRSKHEQIAESISKDGGRTWSELKLIELPNNNSGIESITLKDGRHLLLYNHTGGRPDRADGWGQRNVLNLAVSEDGIEWKEVATIENEDTGEFSYPAMIQASDGLIHMTYTWNRQKVKHVVADPGKLVPGKVLNLESE